MHSRIFQISDSPIAKSDYITVETINDEEWFVNTVADYVQDTDREDSIDWFVKAYQNLECFIWEEGWNQFRLTHDFKTKFFRPGFEDIYLFAQQLQGMLENKETAFKDYVLGDDLRYHIWKLHNITDPFGGFYVYYEPEQELMTIEVFMRHHAECGKRYYFGNVLDYHY